MADTKISADATVTPAGADFIPIVQGGANKKSTIASLPISTATQTALDNKMPRGSLPISTTGGTTTLTSSQFSNNSFDITGTLVSNATIVIPDGIAQMFIIDNATTGAFTLTVKHNATAGIVVSQGTKVILYTTGTIVEGVTATGGGGVSLTENNVLVDSSFTIGSPSSLTTLNDRMNHLWSAGCTDGGAITNNGDGTVNVESSTTLIRQSLQVTSITRTGSTATVTTSSAHGYNSSEVVFINGANQTEYNGSFNITVTGTNTFTYQVVGTPATPATGTIYIANEHSHLIVAVVPAVTNLAMTDHATNYIYAAYNLGTPTYLTTTDGTIVSGLSRVNLWIVSREGTTLDFVDTRATNVDTANKTDLQLHEVETFSHVEGGTQLSEVGTRNIKVTAGAFYHGLNKISHAEFNTSISDTFTYAYQTSGVWTFTTGQTQINNTQYNNTTTGLASLTVGNYGVHWIFMINNDPSRLMVVFGTGDYATKALARAAQKPTIPASLEGTGEVIGKIIIEQGASTFLDVISRYVTRFPVETISLNSLSDVDTPDSPNLNDHLVWNGVSWVNGGASSVSAGNGVIFYNASPTITATGVNNSNAINTLSRIPVTTAEQTQTTSLATNTVLSGAWLYDTALGRTTIDAGVWNFNTFAGVNSVAGGRVTTITRNVMQVIPAGAGTVTTTGTGTSRTATVTGATPFVSGDASATNTNASYLQTPQGLYQITAFISSSVVTISTPTTYTNETGVTYNKWFKLFGATSNAITSISPNYTSNEFFSTQPAFTIAATDKLGFITFGTSNNTTTLTTVYDGTTHNSNVTTPLLTLHNDLVGLQGGQSGQYYHMTAAQATVLSNTSGTNTGNETANTIGSLINGSTAATPNDTDLVATADTSVLKKITWANIKSFLKTYFDTVYQAAGSYLTASNISDTAYGAGWNGDTTNAPSKNAVYDKIETLSSGFAEVPIYDYTGPSIIGILGAYEASRAGTLVEATLICDSLPVGSNLIAELRKNSTTSGNVLSATLQVTTTESATNGRYIGTVVTSFSSTAIADGDVFYVYLTGVGSTTPALNPRLILRYT